MVSSITDIRRLIRHGLFKSNPYYILGGGMNTLFTGDFPGIVIQVNIKGVLLRRQTKYKVVIDVGAGEDWIAFVKFAINKNWGGVENLSYIPGTVGAAPIQNIAAYGQNFEDVFCGLWAVDITTGKKRFFTKKMCQFGYRTSIFKTSLKGKYIVTSVRISLRKKPKVNLSYYSRSASVEAEIRKIASAPYSIKDVSHAIIRIRKTKFPNWNKTGTLGSFFLNPVVHKDKLKIIQKAFPDIQFYPVEKLSYLPLNSEVFKHEDHVKLPAGWLLESAGWRGKRIGEVGTSPNQALVIINYGKANAQDILRFADMMAADCKKKFDIALTPEVNII